MSITALPTPPTRDDPFNFSARGDALMAALPTFVTEANALQTDVNAKQSAAAGSASAASASATAADASAVSAAAAVSVGLGLSTVVVSGTTQTATAGNLYLLTNAAASTLTLPAAPANGAVVGVLVSNGRFDNLVARNGKNIQALAEDLIVDNFAAMLILRYIDSTLQWRLL